MERDNCFGEQNAALYELIHTHQLQAERAHESCSLEIMFMAMKGGAEDIFTPTLWMMPKALTYWEKVAGQDLMGHVKQMEGFSIGNVKGK